MKKIQCRKIGMDKVHINGLCEEELLMVLKTVKGFPEIDYRRSEIKNGVLIIATKDGYVRDNFAELVRTSPEVLMKNIEKNKKRKP